MAKVNSFCLFGFFFLQKGIDRKANKEKTPDTSEFYSGSTRYTSKWNAARFFWYQNHR